MEAMDVLASDIKIVDATTRTAADGGFTLLFPGVFMPDGEGFTGRVDGPLEPAKLRTWCETVRGVYNARQSRKEAEEARRGDLRDAGGDEEDRPTGEPVPTVGGTAEDGEAGQESLEGSLQSEIARWARIERKATEKADQYAAICAEERERATVAARNRMKAERLLDYYLKEEQEVTG